MKYTAHLEKEFRNKYSGVWTTHLSKNAIKIFKNTYKQELKDKEAIECADIFYKEHPQAHNCILTLKKIVEKKLKSYIIIV